MEFAIKYLLFLILVIGGREFFIGFLGKLVYLFIGVFMVI
jgi:hypothetical protein